MKGVEKVFNGISIVGLLILVFWCFQIDYNDLSFSTNRSAYLGILSMGLLIVSMQLVSRQIKNNNKNK